MRILLFSCLFFLFSHALEAQDCFSKLREKGIAAMQNGQFSEAIKKLEAAKTCSDVPQNNDLDQQINEAKRRQRELRNQQERDRRDEAEATENERQRKEAEAEKLKKSRDRYFSQIPTMVKIEGATFKMGSDDGEPDEKPPHDVFVSSFYLSKYEVTVAQFAAFVEDTKTKTDAEKEGFSWKFTDKWEKTEGVNWRHDCEGKLRPQSEYNHPVVHVSWNDAMAFANWCSKIAPGSPFRLPTEAEWEFAAGNGVKHTKYSWGDGSPSGMNGGNVTDETKNPTTGSSWATKFDGYNDGYWYTAPVGSYNSNEFGLFDMTGNVWEWCSDLYDKDYYQNSPRNNPQNINTGSNRVIRGGGWSSYPQYCRSAGRYGYSPSGRDGNLGFRLARSF